MSTRLVLILFSFLVSGAVAAQDDDLGNLSSNPYAPDSTANPYGAGNPYDANSITNPYGKYGSEYSSQSVTNPFAIDTPKLYDSNGNYRGKLSSNPYDPESISNPFGKYGSEYSEESINNPFGAGSPYKSDSPNNPFGTGWKIVGEDADDDPYLPERDNYGVTDDLRLPDYSDPYQNDIDSNPYNNDDIMTRDSWDEYGDNGESDSRYGWEQE